MKRSAGAIILLVTVLASCMPPADSSGSAPSVEIAPSAAGMLTGSEEVEIDPDGRTVVGRLFGSGDVGVVLAHGNRPSLAQAGMYELAAKLADAGYTVLTFNFRSFCPPVEGLAAGCSEGLFVLGTLHRDVIGAVGFLRERGIETVLVVGSSLGATNALYAAAQPDVELAGVVAVSAVQFPTAGEGPPALTPGVMQQIEEPTLFIVGESDAQWADDSPAIYELANEPKKLEVIAATGAHGEDMLGGFQEAVVDDTTELILDFLAANSP